MNQGVVRTVKLLGAMLLGLAIPAAHSLAFLIPYAIMGMLWMAFLDIRPGGFRREHFLLLAANWAIGLGAWALLAFLPAIPRNVALAALLIGLTPTATAAAVVTGMLGRSVTFVTGSILLTNAAAGVLFPLALPLLLGPQISIDTGAFLERTACVVLGPLLVAQGMRVGAPRWTAAILRYRHLSFTVWVIVLFLVTSNAGHFLRTQWAGGHQGREIGLIALTAVVLCAVNFALGRKLGGAQFGPETSQSLGQKNTILTIWIALTCFNPIVALGPTFYILCHNSYNAWQLARAPRGK